jgi:hypothetical protein
MLQLLISDRDVRESAASSARERVQERYLWPQIAQDIERAYWKLIGWPDAADAVHTHPTPEAVKVKTREQVA